MNRAMTILLTHTRMIIIRSAAKHAAGISLATYPVFHGSSPAFAGHASDLFNQIINR